MKLVVGLGNTGSKYAKNRHNIGFRILDQLNLNFKNELKFKGEIAKKNEVIYLKPLTYMNLSGESVKRVVDYYQIDIKDIYIIQDDIDLEFGKIKFKQNSGHGGQNGVRSIIESLKSKQFKRIKIGIGRDPKIPVPNYVLGNFTSEQEAQLGTIIEQVKQKLKEEQLL